MYNKQLDTFFKVAELGSFSKAAEALYITPSAVIQQINNLESSLEARLLVRTQRGAALTPAGELLYREGKKLVEQSVSIRRQLQKLQEEPRKEIRVGTMLLHQCRVFYPLWREFTGDSGEYRVIIEDAIPFFENRGQLDVIEGVSYRKSSPNDMSFLKLDTVPIACAVWKGHPLAAKKRLGYEDMRGQTMVTVDGAQFSDELHCLRREAESHGIHILPVGSYDLTVFSMCAANGYLLQIPLCWRDIHPELTAIPCEWDFSLPYGLFYRPDAGEPTKGFIAFVEKLLQTGGFSFSLSSSSGTELE